MISTREKDMKVEREVAAFLDKNLYSNTDIFSEFARTDGYDEQIHGSDVLLSTTDKKLNRNVVDEKVAISRANVNLPTFSLELSFINNYGKKQIGWFLDSAKTTEYYLFGWITKADIPFNNETGKWEYHELTRDSIREFQWALVSRQKIMKFLEKRGWTMEKLARQDEAIRQRGYVKNPKEFIDDVSFFYTCKNPRMSEKPINILLKKETYMELADHKGIINI
jgi:hypothetical protein